MSAQLHARDILAQPSVLRVRHTSFLSACPRVSQQFTEVRLNEQGADMLAVLCFAPHFLVPRASHTSRQVNSQHHRFAHHDLYTGEVAFCRVQSSKD